MNTYKFNITCTCIDRNGIFPFINSLHFIIGVGDGTQGGGQSTKFGKKCFFFGHLINYVKFGHFIKLCVIKALHSYISDDWAALATMSKHHDATEIAGAG